MNALYAWFHRTLLAAAMVLVLPVQAQDSLAELLEAPGANLSNDASRNAISAAMRLRSEQRLAEAQARAALRGLPLRIVRPGGTLQELAAFEGDEPVYRTTHNANAAISTAANLTRTAYSLDGSGVMIGVWDGGSARASHQEFGGRVVVKDGATSVDHATHVAGTLAATGVVSNARGMSPVAAIDSYDWNNDLSEMTSRGASAVGQAGRIYLSNHSYGFISGWNYVNNGTRVWEWYGNGTTAAASEQDFGRYNTYSRDQDALAYSAPYYLIFRSAGNERTDNPTAGQAVALSPGSPSVTTYDPALHPGGDGQYRGGFENIAYDALAKNVITIGSTTDAVTNGLRDVTKANASSFTSWGPTDDGRIKPDLVANGDGVYSSLNANNSSYGTYSGTSMSTPNAAGSAALLIQHYGVLFPGQAMRASTLKGLMIHTADDRGNPGPDYKYGWGLMNTKAAADLITDHKAYPDKQRITENGVSTSVVSRTHTFVWDGVSPIRATLCWTDPAGSATTTSDLRTPRLVNNLNLKVTAPGGGESLPYIMPFVGSWTQSSMDSAAVTGVNNTDNVEQILISSPSAPGTYQATVSFSGTLANGSQNYSLLISGAAATPPPPQPLSITAITPASSLPGVVTVDLSGTGFRADTAVKLARSGQSDINGTAVQLVGDSLRCVVDVTTAAPGLWNVVATNPGGETFTLSSAFTLIGALWSESFDASPSGWTSQAVTGSNQWTLVNTLSHSPSTSYFVPAPEAKTTTNLTSPAIPIPANASNLQLKFWHSYALQTGQDGGRLEFSLDNGAWFDVTSGSSGAVLASNGYTTTIAATGPPPSRSDFAGLSAWSGNSGGFIETVVNLNDTPKYAGHSLRMRWRLATNSGTASAGWHVDSMALIGGGDLANQAPQITVAADSSSTETVTDPDGTAYQIVRGTSTGLTVTATDDGGEAGLTYTWSVTSGPPAVVSFATNGNNAAKATEASFETHGDYRIMVSATDAAGLTVSSGVNVRVVQTASDLAVSPASVTLPVGGSQAFSAALLNQFGSVMEGQSLTVDWSASGGGPISSQGVFTPTTAGGPYVITAAASGFTGIASATVTPAPAGVTLGDLEQVYNGSPRPVSVTTSPPGLSFTVTYNGSAPVPTAAGSYAVEVTVTDPNYQGGASGTLNVAKAPATVTLASLAQTYDGTPRVPAIETVPTGLTVSLTYDGSAVAPVNAGAYSVEASIDDPNYLGSTSGTLVVSKASATIHFDDLFRIYDGTAKTVTVTTSPAELPVTVTYDGAAEAPSAIGNYAVQAEITDPNYQGSGSAMFAITGIDYATWKASHFDPAEIEAGAADFTADPDQDSLNNLLEYALGTDPKAFSSPPAMHLDATHLTLEFTRPKALPDASYHPEAGSDLEGWTFLSLEIVDSSGSSETVRARVERPAGGPALFIRLRVEEP